MASSGYSLTAQIPKYLVLPTSSPSMARDFESCQVKLVDFGEAFLVGQQRQIRCPLVFRAPEAVLTSQWDLQADIWSLGCTVCCITPSADHFKLSTNNWRRYSSWSSDTPLSITSCRKKMNLYENGFQCLEIYQTNGEMAFLPRELLVCICRRRFL